MGIFFNRKNMMNHYFYTPKFLWMIIILILISIFASPSSSSISSHPLKPTKTVVENPETNKNNIFNVPSSSSASTTSSSAATSSFSPGVFFIKNSKPFLLNKYKRQQQVHLNNNNNKKRNRPLKIKTRKNNMMMMKMKRKKIAIMKNKKQLHRNGYLAGSGSRNPFFSVMLPKGFVPPSGSSPCNNQNPNSAFSFSSSYCDLSTNAKP